MRNYELNAIKPPKEIFSGHLKYGGVNPEGVKISFTNYYMEMSGNPYFLICGEYHFSRYSRDFWEKELLKMKMCGINTVATYIFWNHHEEEQGVFDWEENRDLRSFVELCQKHELYVILRIGPFCHGEARNGGLPDWLHGRPFEVRTNDPVYLLYVKRLYSEIGRQVSGLMFKDGGRVIGIQLENEHMSAASFWENVSCLVQEWTAGASKDPEEGKEHLRFLKALAMEAGLDAPLYTCTGWGSPVIEDEVLPLYGDYAFWPWIFNNPERKEHPPTHAYLFCSYHEENTRCLNYNPSHSRTGIPFACCEMGGGAQITYKYRFSVPPESVEAMALMKVAGGCNFIGYYMFHGGSNPVGKHSFLNERSCPMISYDFMAPIGEFGQVRESYLRLKPFHYFLKSFEEDLCGMQTVLPINSDELSPDNTEDLRYAVRVKGNRGFLFLNNFQDHLEMKDQNDFSISVILDGETLSIPKKNGMNLKKDVCCALPFNMDLRGIRLIYSTSQPITTLQHSGEYYYFFFIPEGMKGEYCLDASEIREVRTGDSPMERLEDRILLTAVENSLVRLTSYKGEIINIITLTKEQSKNLWKAQLQGRERMILTDVVVMASEDNLSLQYSQKEEINIGIFPDEDIRLLYGNTTVLPKMKDGIFNSYCIETSCVEISPDIVMAGKSRASLRFCEKDFLGAGELLLKIDYTGDIGYAYIDGKLINDNFCNGQTWEIGLKRFEKELLEKGMYIYIYPIKKGNVVSFDSAMAAVMEEAGEEIAEIHSISVVAVYELNIKVDILG